MLCLFLRIVVALIPHKVVLLILWYTFTNAGQCEYFTCNYIDLYFYSYIVYSNLYVVSHIVYSLSTGIKKSCKRFIYYAWNIKKTSKYEMLNIFIQWENLF